MPLLVVSGPPGAGKTTVARILAADETPSALVTGDTFYTFLHRGGVDPWRPEAIEQNTAVTEAAAAAAGRLARDRHVVYDGMVGAWFVPAFLAASGLPDLDYVVLLPDEATCEHRVATRTGHGFTDLEAARHLHREFAGARLDTRHMITDAAGGPGALATLIRHRRADGRLRVSAD